MESQAYPGKGLSLPQLVYALNMEMNGMTHSSSLTLDQLSQLANDISTASMAIRELRNSLVPVNLLPLDVLLLIPTHLASLSERLLATFVCRHWRRSFVQHAPLWSQLSLTGTTDRSLLITLLERAKQSPLDITLCYSGSPMEDVTLLSPFAQQIRDLNVEDACQGDIQTLSNALPGSLPLLRTLRIEDNGYTYSSRPLFDPTLPLFSGAVNVNKLALRAFRSSFLSQLAFRTLTTLDLVGHWDKYPISLLLDFLEASPSLQKIKIAIVGRIPCEDVPQDRVLVLPCVKTFFLHFTSNSRGWEFASHLSCPSAERASFRLQPTHHSYGIPEDIYPPPLPWNAITCQYTMGMVEEVQLKFEVDEELTCSITFWSSNEATLVFHYNHFIGSGHERNMTSAEKIGSDVFSRASRAIRNHPLLAKVRRLRIQGGGLLAADLKLATNDVGKLLGSVGPLDKLYLNGCDLRPYLDPFLEIPLFPDAIQPASFPPIKEFVIVDPIQSLFDNKAYAAAVVKLAKSQYARGVPFGHVTLRPTAPSWVVEELSLSVDVVEFGQILSGGGQGQK